MAARNRWLLLVAATLIATPVLAQEDLPPLVNIFGHPVVPALSAEDAAQVAEYILQGQSAYAAAEYDNALASYNAALELAPDNVGAKMGVAQVLGSRGATAAENAEYEAAQADFDAAIEIYPEIVNVYPFLVQRGYLAWRMGNPAAALVDFEAAVALDNSPLAHEYRAHANFDLGNNEAALADYNISIAAGLEASLSYYNRGVILEGMGDMDAALIDFSRALELDPNWANAHLYRASIYARQGEIESAAPDYLRWIQLSETARELRPELPPDEPITLTMTYGQTYYIPFSALPGRRVTITADALTAGLDPLIVLLNRNDEPIFASDDISPEDFDSAIESFRLPNGRDFMLVVSHAGGGSEGELEVTLTFE
jgi:tetratricopeptide (TPR) repeat protein